MNSWKLFKPIQELCVSSAWQRNTEYNVVHFNYCHSIIHLFVANFKFACAKCTNSALRIAPLKRFCCSVSPHSDACLPSSQAEAPVPVEIVASTSAHKSCETAAVILVRHDCCMLLLVFLWPYFVSQVTLLVTLNSVLVYMNSLVVKYWGIWICFNFSMTAFRNFKLFPKQITIRP